MIKSDISTKSKNTEIDKINLFDLNRQQMREFFVTLGEKPFCADQIMKWIYHKFCDDFNKMYNIKNTFRNKLNQIAKIHAPKVIKEYHSYDGTIKWMIKVGCQHVETVYIPEKKRRTLCISSQVGCALKCTFCSTGQQGFNRNLKVSEIIGQVWTVANIIRKRNLIGCHPITNIVMMGMGEPLLNLANVVPAIEIMFDRFGFGLSKRRVTLSTSGIIPALDKLSDIIDVSLAISLHAPNDKIRNSIIPINKKYNIQGILQAVNRYISKSNANQGRVTIEYIMIDHINDSTDNAHELACLLKETPCKINLIPWNSFPNSLYTRSSNSRIDRFSKVLISYGYITTVRKTRGNDINAACGQLTGEITNKSRKTIKDNMVNNMTVFLKKN